ncbi:Uncharacterised protein [Flavonifractor plautii]|nr:Uncharacterised protein [Flavonifractor plautii]
MRAADVDGHIAANLCGVSADDPRRVIVRRSVFVPAPYIFIGINRYIAFYLKQAGIIDLLTSSSNVPVGIKTADTVAALIRRITGDNVDVTVHNGLVGIFAHTIDAIEITGFYLHGHIAFDMGIVCANDVLRHGVDRAIEDQRHISANIEIRFNSISAVGGSLVGRRQIVAALVTPIADFACQLDIDVALHRAFVAAANDNIFIISGIDLTGAIDLHIGALYGLFIAAAIQRVGNGEFAVLCENGSMTAAIQRPCGYLDIIGCQIAHKLRSQSDGMQGVSITFQGNVLINNTCKVRISNVTCQYNRRINGITFCNLIKRICEVLSIADLINVFFS